MTAAAAGTGPLIGAESERYSFKESMWKIVLNPVIFCQHGGQKYICCCVWLWTEKYWPAVLDEKKEITKIVIRSHYFARQYMQLFFSYWGKK